MENIKKLIAATPEEQKSFLMTLALQDLARMQVEIKDRLDDLKAEATRHQKLFDLIRLSVVPEKMDEEDISSITIEGVGRLTLTSDIYARLLDKDKGYNWLMENGYGDLIKPTVNASSLKSLLKELIREGVAIPDYFKVDPFSRASVTRK